MNKSRHNNWYKKKSEKHKVESLWLSTKIKDEQVKRLFNSLQNQISRIRLEKANKARNHQNIAC